MYESVASTVVFSPTKHLSGRDTKTSNYSYLSSDDESVSSQGDNNSENSFIKVLNGCDCFNNCFFLFFYSLCISEHI